MPARQKPNANQEQQAIKEFDLLMKAQLKAYRGPVSVLNPGTLLRQETARRLFHVTNKNFKDWGFDTIAKDWQAQGIPEGNGVNPEAFGDFLVKAYENEGGQYPEAQAAVNAVLKNHTDTAAFENEKKETKDGSTNKKKMMVAAFALASRQAHGKQVHLDNLIKWHALEAIQQATRLEKGKEKAQALLQFSALPAGCYVSNREGRRVVLPAKEGVGIGLREQQLSWEAFEGNTIVKANAGRFNHAALMWPMRAMIPSWVLRNPRPMTVALAQVQYMAERGEWQNEKGHENAAYLYYFDDLKGATDLNEKNCTADVDMATLIGLEAKFKTESKNHENRQLEANGKKAQHLAKSEAKAFNKYVAALGSGGSGNPYRCDHALYDGPPSDSQRLGNQNALLAAGVMAATRDVINKETAATAAKQAASLADNQDRNLNHAAMEAEKAHQAAQAAAKHGAELCQQNKQRMLNPKSMHNKTAAMNQQAMRQYALSAIQMAEQQADEEINAGTAQKDDRATRVQTLTVRYTQEAVLTAGAGSVVALDKDTINKLKENVKRDEASEKNRAAEAKKNGPADEPQTVESLDSRITQAQIKALQAEANAIQASLVKVDLAADGTALQNDEKQAIKDAARRVVFDHEPLSELPTDKPNASAETKLADEPKTTDAAKQIRDAFLTQDGNLKKELINNTTEEKQVLNEQALNEARFANRKPASQGFLHKVTHIAMGLFGSEATPVDPNDAIESQTRTGPKPQQ